MSKSTIPQSTRLRLLILSPSTTLEEDEGSTAKILHTDTSNARFASFLTSLTSVAPSRDLTTFAGYTSHPPLSISTKYYAAQVTIWCDELPPVSTSSTPTAELSLPEWTSQMSSSEAQEVREVIGGIVVLFSFNAASTKQQAEAKEIISYITAVNQVRETIEDESGRDVATILAVQDVTPPAAAERQSSQGRDGDVNNFTQKLEESCLDEHGIFGWDIVAWKARNSATPDDQDSDLPTTQTETGSDTERNEFGERLGMARVREVLEQVNWSVTNSSLDQDDDDDNNDYDPLATDDFLDDVDAFDMPSFKPKIQPSAARSKDPILEQSDEFQREIMGLHFALEEQNGGDSARSNADDGNDIQVEKLSNLMERVVAIREAGSEMSKADREKFARREVGKIMREMNFDE